MPDLPSKGLLHHPETSEPGLFRVPLGSQGRRLGQPGRDAHTPLFHTAPRMISRFQKFVSTTLRPTLMPYPELYNWDTCAQFVSDFLTMVPLVDPLKPVSATSWLRGLSPAGLI